MKQLLSVLGTILALGLPLVRAYIQTHWSPKKLDSLVGLARIAVAAAEQEGEENGQKFILAASYLKSAARRIGWKLTDAEVNGFIESAVRELKQYSQLEPLDLDAFQPEAPEAA